MEPYLVVAATLIVLIVLKGLILLVAGKGSLTRLGPAMDAFFTVMGSPEKAAKVALVLNPPPPDPAKAPKLSGEPLRLLNLLQRDEGRILDFVLEDIAGASDDQIIAGVRRLHQAWQKVIKEHLTLEPIMAGQEDETVTVPVGFDPSAIRVTGNVTGNPPFKGVVRHRGWRVRAYKLPAPPDGIDELVIAPAEVELP
jgi:Domain of unknown function (DUF2760)